uniref:hypothetical protein n=1 Tax=Flavobacterium sp. TaxID=239 RepID=UPI004048F3C8
MMFFLKKNRKKIGFGLFFLGFFFAILYLNTTISFLFKSKILVHRVNSVEKLLEVKDNYVGVEFDVMYDSISNFFDVNHPPAESIQLDINEYLSNSASCKETIYWIDFKNVSSFNKEASLLKLNSIVKDLNIPRNKIIIESTLPKLIQGFKKEGYLTSYYLPPYLNTKNKDSLAFYISEIELTNKKYPTDYISFNYKDYPIIKNNFPDAKKLTWFTGGTSLFQKIPSKLLLYTILLDENVDYVLLPYKGKSKER